MTATLLPRSRFFSNESTIQPRQESWQQRPCHGTVRSARQGTVWKNFLHNVVQISRYLSTRHVTQCQEQVHKVHELHNLAYTGVEGISFTAPISWKRMEKEHLPKNMPQFWDLCVSVYQHNGILDNLLEKQQTTILLHGSQAQIWKSQWFCSQLHDRTRSSQASKENTAQGEDILSSRKVRKIWTTMKHGDSSPACFFHKPLFSLCEQTTTQVAQVVQQWCPLLSKCCFPWVEGRLVLLTRKNPSAGLQELQACRGLSVSIWHGYGPSCACGNGGARNIKQKTPNHKNT